MLDVLSAFGAFGFGSIKCVKYKASVTYGCDARIVAASAQKTIMNSSHRFDRYLGTLWRNRDFRTLWLSLTITHFGGQVTLLALPLTAAILLHATPVEMGILVAMEALPYTLLGLFTGVLVDRSRKLRLIIQADIARGVVLLLVPIAAWGGFLSMSILYVVGFLVGFKDNNLSENDQVLLEDLAKESAA